MAADLDDFLPKVLLRAPDVPDLVAFAKLRQVARRFCTVTKIWRQTDTLNVSTPEGEAAPTIADADIVRIMHARLDGHTLKPVTVAWLDENVLAWQDYVENSSPGKYITQLQPDVMLIVPKATGSLEVRLALMPSQACTTFPQFLFDHYADQLGAAAAGECLLTPNEPYTNPQLGVTLQAGFEHFLDTSRTSAIRGQQRSRLRTKPSNF